MASLNGRTTLSAIYGGSVGRGQSGQTPQTGGINSAVSPLAAVPGSAPARVATSGADKEAPAISWIGILILLVALGFLASKANGGG